MTGPQPQGFAAMNAAAQPPPPPMPPMAQLGGGPGHFDGPPGGMMGGPPPGGLMGGPPSAAANNAAKKPPIEFDQAINYVTKIKTRFAKQPETYKAFLEILHTYQKEQKTIKEVYEQVSTLFKNHSDLLGEFSQFLPDGSPEGQGLLGQGKGKGKGGMGGLMGGPMKQPVPQRPNQKPGARGGDDEEERFWQKQKNKGRAGGKPMSGVHNTEEAKFFSMCRNRMPKPQYLELLKCLNLYSQQIVDRSELLTLVHDLFKRSSPDLFSSFRKLLGYSGGGALPERDAPSPPTALQPPSAEGGNFRDLDFTTMRRQGTSYRILPDTYAMPSCSGRGPLETLVLNDVWVSVATGTEDLNFKAMRKNQYEESIFRAEDERFELDTTIETNFATIQMLQPIAAEINNLSEQEKRRYKLPQPLTAMHQKSIRRLYGAQGAPVIELLQKCPAAAAGSLLKRLQQKDEEWRALRVQCGKTWKEVYEKNYTKSLDHRSFYFKQGDKKNFSGKQMCLELKALTETEDSKGDGEGAPAPAPSSSQQQQPAEGGGPSVAPNASMMLPFAIKHTSLTALHADTLQLSIFAAKINFSVFEGEIEEKIEAFWKDFVVKFFVCPDLPAELAEGGKAAASSSSAMDVDDDDGLPKTKPLLIVAAGMGEELATRDARPPEQRWSMPLSYPKTSNQLLIGNSHFYIFARLYHIIMCRLDAARGMARKAEKVAAAAESTGEKPAETNGVAAGAAAAEAGASAEHVSRSELLKQIRTEAKGDLYVAFQSCLKQLIDGKMEASTYEDVLRTLLGTNAYLLFTLHKIISQALKQLQMLLVEETSQKLLDLYEYERQRASAGSMAESTYRSNARMVLEGDDCFRMEQMYSAGDFETMDPEVGNGGGLLVSFLPEKEEDDDEDVEEDDEDDDEEGDEAGKAETVAYMQAFMQCTRVPTIPKKLLIKSAMRSPKWDVALNRPGLECRSAVGSCKLRFVCRSEDLWLANTKRLKAKREQQPTDTRTPKALSQPHNPLTHPSLPTFPFLQAPASVRAAARRSGRSCPPSSTASSQKTGRTRWPASRPRRPRPSPRSTS